MSSKLPPGNHPNIIKFLSSDGYGGPELPKEIASRKTARPEIPDTKVTTAHKPSNSEARKRKQPRVSKPQTQTHNTQPCGPHTMFHLPFEEISGLLYHLPLQACVELTRRLLTPISLPTEAASRRAVLKTLSVRGRIWQHYLGGSRVVKPCS